MPNVEIEAGIELDQARYTMDRDLIADYLSVVESEPALYQPGDLVPPTAMAAVGLRAPGGHLGPERCVQCARHAGQPAQGRAVPRPGVRDCR